MLNQGSPSLRHLRDRDRHLLLCSRFVAMMGLVSLIPIVTFHNNITDHTYLSHDLPSKQPNSNDNFSLARTQSFGFFDDITNEHWRRLQDIVARHWNHLYPETPLARHPSLENNWRYPQWWQSVSILCVKVYSLVLITQLLTSTHSSFSLSLNSGSCLPVAEMEV